MAKPLTLLVKIEAVPEKTELVKRELIKLLAPTLKEAGCTEYNLHQVDETPSTFIFVETWQTREHWEAHNETEHLAVFRRAVENAIANISITEITQLQP